MRRNWWRPDKPPEPEKLNMFHAVAREMVNSWNRQTGFSESLWSMLGKYEKRFASNQAQSVFKVLRNPTRDMLKAGQRHEKDGAAAVWQAMIDEASKGDRK